MVKVYVAGSFQTVRDIERVVELQQRLREEGLDVLNQLEPFEWRREYDFLLEVRLAKRVIEYDLSLLKEADVIVALADKPSFGVGAEVIYAKRVLNKKVVAVLTAKAKSPWIVMHADAIVCSFDPSRITKAVRQVTQTR